MNDAERDAWLREALRHAPDSDALPPSGVSESILLQARAAARAAPAPARRDQPRAARSSALARFWTWLARPPVAGAFASVMAATLVGLMWWDRPMDETLVPPPATTSDRRGDTSPPAAETAPAAAIAPLPDTATAPPASPSPTTSPAPTAPPAPTPSSVPAVPREVALSAAPAMAAKARPEQEAARDAKVARPAPAPATAKLEPLAKEQAAPVAPKGEAPAPFPAPEFQRETPLAAKSLDAAKKDGGAEQRAATESRRPAAAANVAEADALRRRDVASGGAAAPAAATGRLSAQSAAPGGAPERPRALGDERDKSVAGFAAAAPTPFSSTPAPARAEAGGRSAAPLASVLAAISADPGTWSRRTAGGDSFALDAGWRAWLSDLDAAAAGRWRAVDSGATGEAAADRGDRDGGATTLRLVARGSVAAVVRVEGTTVQVELPGGAGRWQATLSAAAADRLRASAQRLPR